MPGGQPEIQDPGTVLARDHDVSGLQIAMYDSRAVSRRQALGDLAGQLPKPGNTQRAAAQKVA